MMEWVFEVPLKGTNYGKEPERLRCCAWSLVFSAWSASAVVGKAITIKLECSGSPYVLDRAVSDTQGKELDCFGGAFLLLT